MIRSWAVFRRTEATSAEVPIGAERILRSVGPRLERGKERTAA